MINKFMLSNNLNELYKDFPFEFGKVNMYVS